MSEFTDRSVCGLSQRCCRLDLVSAWYDLGAIHSFLMPFQYPYLADICPVCSTFDKAYHFICDSNAIREPAHLKRVWVFNRKSYARSQILGSRGVGIVFFRTNQNRIYPREDTVLTQDTQSNTVLNRKTI